MSRNSSASKIKMHSVDDLFSVSEAESITGAEKVINVALSDLHTFKNHPFKVKNDEKMVETVKSIKENGVLHPGLYFTLGITETMVTEAIKKEKMVMM